MGATAPQVASFTIVYSIVYWDADQRKHQSSVGNSPATGEFPAQMASNAENVSIWWRHHVILYCSSNWVHAITEQLHLRWSITFKREKQSTAVNWPNCDNCNMHFWHNHEITPNCEFYNYLRSCYVIDLVETFIICMTFGVKTVYMCYNIQPCILNVDDSDDVSRYLASINESTWWRHQMEAFSALLALCEGDPSVIDGSPTQRPVTRSVDVFFISAGTNGWANDRDVDDLRRHRAHYGITVMNHITNKHIQIWLMQDSGPCFVRQCIHRLWTPTAHPLLLHAM